MSRIINRDLFTVGIFKKVGEDRKSLCIIFLFSRFLVLHFPVFLFYIFLF